MCCAEPLKAVYPSNSVSALRLGPALRRRVSAVCLVKAPAIQVERVGEERGETGRKSNVDVRQGYHPWAGSKKTRRLRCQIISRFQASGMSRRTSLQTGQTEEEHAWRKCLEFYGEGKEIDWVLCKLKDTNDTNIYLCRVLLIRIWHLNYPSAKLKRRLVHTKPTDLLGQILVKWSFAFQGKPSSFQ